MRADGVPSEVDIVRSDSGGDLVEISGTYAGSIASNKNSPTQRVWS